MDNVYIYWSHLHQVERPDGRVIKVPTIFSNIASRDPDQACKRIAERLFCTGQMGEGATIALGTAA